MMKWNVSPLTLFVMSVLFWVKSVHKFEEEFARDVGRDFAVSTSSWQNGAPKLQCWLLESILDKLVSSCLLFIASANAIIHAQGVRLAFPT